MRVSIPTGSQTVPARVPSDASEWPGRAGWGRCCSGDSSRLLPRRSRSILQLSAFSATVDSARTLARLWHIGTTSTLRRHGSVGDECDRHHRHPWAGRSANSSMKNPRRFSPAAVFNTECTSSGFQPWRTKKSGPSSGRIVAARHRGQTVGSCSPATPGAGPARRCPAATA